MPVCCEVCSSSFKESKALQMHKAAKGHDHSAAGDTAAKNTSRDQVQTKATSSLTRTSTGGELSSSGSLKFPCKSCDRFFKSREALRAHVEAKKHPLTTTAKVQRPEKALFRCDVCGRCNFGSQGALNDHKRDSNGHQTGNRRNAPPKMPPDSETRTDHGLPLQNKRAFPLMVDKAAQCDLCSCNSLGSKTCDSDMIAPSWEGQKQQRVPLSNVGNHHPLALSYRYHSGNPAFCQLHEMCLAPKGYAIDATSQRPTLTNESNTNGVPPPISSFLISQPAITKDFLTQNPSNPQMLSELVDVYRSVRPEPLKHLGKEWSAISLYEQPLALKVLQDLCHSVSDLERNGYRLRQYTSTDLMEEQICKACKRRRRDIRRLKIPCKSNPKKKSRSLQNNGRQAQVYAVNSKADQVNDFLSSHQFPTTDERKQSRDLGSAWTPEKDPQRPKCPTIALDCEMVEVIGNGGLWREVVQVSAIDFLSGETLVNTLVLPTAKVKRWKTEITGITSQTVSEATAQGRTVKGWTEARSELWRHIDAGTVLVGQSLHHDLDVLGMLHTRVVDSAILAATAIDLKGTRTFGLKQMCKEMLNVDIQCVNGGVHDCLEDVLASRELVLYFISSPKEWQTWALFKREEELGRKARSQRQRKDRTATTSRQEKCKWRDVGDDWDDAGGFFDDDEILYWEDIAEDLGWPHPDTGYDPWSD